MRILTLTAVLVAAAVTPLAAQDNPNGLPLHLHFYEGDSADTTLFGQAPYVRWQQIDTDSNFFHIIKFFKLRRDFAAAAPAATAQTVDIELALGFQTLAAFGSNFNNNFLFAGVFDTRTAVFPRTSVSLPDWSQIPDIRPKPFELSIPIGFYSHQAVSGTTLVWEMQVWNTAATTHPLDATAENGTFLSSLARRGAGCGTFKADVAVDVTNWGAQTALKLGVTNAPPSQLITYLLGITSPAFPIAGVCGLLRTDLAIGTAPIGVSSPGGTLSATLPLGVYSGAFANFAFSAQALAQPSFSLSDGVAAAFPIMPAPFSVRSLWTTNPLAATGTGPLVGGIVVEIVD